MRVSGRSRRQDDIVEITNERGSVRVKAKLTGSIKKGVVFLPMHRGKILQRDSAQGQ